MELPIFSDNLRSSAAWSVALGREREQWQQAQASAEAQAQLDARLRALQVQESIKRAALSVPEPQTDERENFLRAARLISTWAAQPEAVLTVERVTELYRVLAGIGAEEEVFRQTETQPLAPGHNPAPAIILPRLLENAFDWFTAPSFAEIHVVEQAALVHLRLLDLQPFATHHEQTALLAASFYTERALWPPLIIYADEASTARYTAAMSAAFRMLTQPLVEFFAENLAQTIKHLTGAER